ncbi:UvrD-helicase domain-containing protein [Neolewinella lacunae]|uniref:DNA 3'-5' helicase n=1 Tax=Neolewinella lacunae TaxID=1517758 RepID=A0A923PIG5_9BACT|nr:UvrD-helicase domain-containing protein [Neolewinella lacunae]MBC6994682.1 UvrD-helicase domain-containing protein [Neolewinella lacunae]MDN3634554.1 UvrD-helicase domain-containing protein [Neolewinella lacunae]
MLNNLKLISAGAGSGKTYRLTQEMISLLASGAARPSGIIATTFTKRAAAELRERVRVKLLREGLTTEANELKNALIGTVHGLGVKLLRRFAFEAGVSPEVDIIADEDHQRLFNLSMAAVIPLDTIEEIELLCEKLGLSQSGEKYNWRGDVLRLVEVIRANNFSAATIEKSKRLSWESLAAFLPPPVSSPTPEQLKSRASVALTETARALENNEQDGTKKTLTAASYLKRLASELQRRGHLPWYEYCKLARFVTEVGAKSRELVDEVVALGNLHPALEAFQSDVRSYQDLLFTCASAAIEEYDRYKKSRGRIDYTDMEVLVLNLLDHPGVQETLRRELDLLMVDEFQDTSPIQLAVFLKLSQLARQSVWVGDPKQSIYGFRGAEPRLMAAVVHANGPMPPENIQRYSWRSRQDIVLACNAIFTRAFPELPAAEVVLEPVRWRAGGAHSPPESPELAQHSALRHWHFELEGPGLYARGWHQDVTAKAIRELLDNPLPIVPREGGPERPLRPADVAVLCRTNYGCVAMAEALARQGIPAAIARTGLLQTAEATLLLACLKYILNRSDSLSVAEILLFGSRHRLPEIIESRLDYLEQENDGADTDRASAWAEADPFIAQLDALRVTTTEHSSSEMLNLLLERLDLRRTIVAWGDGEQRLSNVDELRRLAVAYEDSCHRQHRAASLGGYLLYLDQLLRSDRDKQGAGERADAVNVLTYHRSKGLEWPAVVAMDLEQDLRADVWGLAVVPETETVDLSRPLADRWVKFWVNPYARLTSGVPWLNALLESQWQQTATNDALAEEARLLYVGFTRARDYLILPTAKKGAPWLDRAFVRGGGVIPVLDPHSNQAPFDWQGHEVTKYLKTWTEPRNLPSATMQYTAVQFLAGERPGPGQHQPLEPTEDWLLAHYGHATLGGRQLYFQGPVPDPQTDERLLSQAIGAFLQGDFPPLAAELRAERARHLLEAYLPGSQEASDPFVAQSSAFQAWLAGLGAVLTGAGAQVQRRVVEQGTSHGRQLHLTADYLMATPDDALILLRDVHLPARQFDQQQGTLAAELCLLGELISRNTGKKIAAAFLHLPALGSVFPLGSGAAENP